MALMGPNPGIMPIKVPAIQPNITQLKLLSVNAEATPVIIPSSMSIEGLPFQAIAQLSPSRQGVRQVKPQKESVGAFHP